MQKAGFLITRLIFRSVNHLGKSCSSCVLNVICLFQISINFKSSTFLLDVISSILSQCNLLLFYQLVIILNFHGNRSTVPISVKNSATACIYHLSLVMRKPAFCICENKDADQLRGNREADQRLCFRYTDSTIPLLPKDEISSF